MVNVVVNNHARKPLYVVCDRIVFRIEECIRGLISDSRGLVGDLQFLDPEDAVSCLAEKRIFEKTSCPRADVDDKCAMIRSIVSKLQI